MIQNLVYAILIHVLDQLPLSSLYHFYSVHPTSKMAIRAYFSHTSFSARYLAQGPFPMFPLTTEDQSGEANAQYQFQTQAQFDLRSFQVVK